MQLHTPDPGFIGSERARMNFQLAVRLALGFVALLWAIHLLGWLPGLDLRGFGIRPRELGGLPGILFAPLLHGDLAHLFSNSVPLVVLGTMLLYLYPNTAPRVFAAIYLGTGIIVWLLARPAVHIGASGLVYGLVSYIFWAGLLRWDMRAIAASMLVYFLYGTLAWGVLPIWISLSWETHLIAAVIGMVLAVGFRHWDIPPRKHYSWEDEEDEDGPDRPV
jgi:membrane associated rhomboid family serine protease